MKIILAEGSQITDDEIKKGLEELKIISKLISKQPKKDDDKLLNFNQTADYLGVSHSYLYKLTAKNLIPCHRPMGRLYFYKHELDSWIKHNDKNVNNLLDSDLSQEEENDEDEEDPP